MQQKAQRPSTLASGIDLGQGINVGPGKFVKKIKRRALNRHVLYTVKIISDTHKFYLTASNYLLGSQIRN